MALEPHVQCEECEQWIPQSSLQCMYCDAPRRPHADNNPGPLDYTIVHGETMAVLRLSVRARIEKGWRPIGGVAVASIGEDLCEPGFYQAMVI